MTTFRERDERHANVERGLNAERSERERGVNAERYVP